MNCGQFNGTPRCSAAQIDSELDRLHGIGVRSLFPVHKFDNALGGAHFDSGAAGVLVNVGNKYATGRFWTAESCPGATDHDNEPTNITGEHAALIYTLFGPLLTQPLLEGQLPVYPPAPLCNPKGLTPLGEHLIAGDDGQGHDRRDRPPEREGATRGADDPRGDRLPRRDLQPQLG